MLTKWFTLRAMFTNDELKLMSEFLTKNNIKQNALLRAGAQAILWLADFANAIEDPQVEVLRCFYEETQKKK